MRKMEATQNAELLHVEQIQRQQFQEFTDAWDSYMGEYEQNAFLSVERLKQDQMRELTAFREGYFDQVKNRYLPSKRLLDIRTAERKAFSSKQYS